MLEPHDAPPPTAAAAVVVDVLVVVVVAAVVVVVVLGSVVRQLHRRHLHHQLVRAQWRQQQRPRPQG
jgi:uncharacterized membrane protein YccC